MEEDLAVEAVVLENHQGEVLALHLQVLVSKVEVQRLARAVEASVHRQVEASESQAEVQRLARAVEDSVHRHLDLEVIKDLNQEAVFR